MLNTDTFGPDLHSKEITCGKSQPGRIPKIKPTDRFSFNSYTNMDILLTFDSKAVTENSVNDYTLLLNEGILIKTNNLVLNTFWRYNYIGTESELSQQNHNYNINPELFKQKGRDYEGDKALFESICYETLVGKQTK